MDISRYELRIQRHAYLRAYHRGVHPDIIRKTIVEGYVERFGKHGIKFIKKGKKRTIICVGRCIGEKIQIFTIEVKE
ncbi:MAG: hypothetical protein AABX86_01545 [Nanoarchaeota archaeon]